MTSEYGPRQIGETIEELKAQFGPNASADHKIAGDLGISSARHPTLHVCAYTLCRATGDETKILGDQLDQERDVFPAFLLTVAARGYNLYSEGYEPYPDGPGGETEIELLSRTLSNESKMREASYPKTSYCITRLYGIYQARDCMSLASAIGQSFWDNLIRGGLDDVMNRSFDRTMKTDRLNHIDRLHIYTLICMRAEVGTYKLQLPKGDPRKEVLDDIAEYHRQCFIGDSRRSLEASQEHFRDLVEALRGGGGSSQTLKKQA